MARYRLDFSEQYLKKGDEVAVEGKLASRTYTDKDGVKRYFTEIVVNEFLKVGAKISRHLALKY